MRLINTHTKTFVEFPEREAPEYAVVSHKWGSDEVSYSDFLEDTYRRGRGWLKILKACKIAAARNVHWLWLDACCIDKRNTAEVAKSINSMYKWYQNAKECYAFLPDVNVGRSHADFAHQFRHSVWFERGWTLQELLVPPEVQFYNSTFQYLGRKRNGLDDHISAATGIGLEYLQDSSRIRNASVAERMRWASRRQTTEIEDEAYCLLGLFDISMSPCYGEGEKAFIRLQRKILQKTEDESIFAWWTDRDWTGLLAPSPAAFAGDLPIEAYEYKDRAPILKSGKGLRLTVRAPGTYIDAIANYLLPLNCNVVSHSQPGGKICQQIAIGIRVSPIGQSETGALSLRGTSLQTSSRSQRLMLAQPSQWLNNDLEHWSYDKDCDFAGVLPALDSARESGSRVIYFKQDGL